MDITQFLHYIHVTPITGILSGFQIILQKFCRYVEKCAKRSIFKTAMKNNIFM